VEAGNPALCRGRGVSYLAEQSSWFKILEIRQQMQVVQFWSDRILEKGDSVAWLLMFSESAASIHT
jgi:hypothetical protein